LNDENDEAQNVLEEGMKVAIDIGDNETINEIKNFKNHIQYHRGFGRFEDFINGPFDDFIGDLDDYDEEDEEDY